MHTPSQYAVHAGWRRTTADGAINTLRNQYRTPLACNNTEDYIIYTHPITIGPYPQWGPTHTQKIHTEIG